jgi:hypothetical protein
MTQSLTIVDGDTHGGVGGRATTQAFFGGVGGIATKSLGDVGLNL